METLAVHEHATPADAGRRAGVVLIVDDEPLIREIIRRALRRRGLDSLVAASPAEALGLARRHGIALLVTDLVMPGMTGIELAGRLRHLHPDVPVVLVSATPDASALAIEAPSAVLAKPFTLADLVTTAERLVGIPTALPS